MKKFIAAMLIAVTMLTVGTAALAETEKPTFGSFAPIVVLADLDDTRVNENSFNGEWVLKAAFLGQDYVDNETLASKYHFNFAPFTIGDGKIKQEVKQENGEVKTQELSYTFESGQLQGVTADGVDFAVDLQEDGNIILAFMFKDETNEPVCLSLFLVHPEK